MPISKASGRRQATPHRQNVPSTPWCVHRISTRKAATTISVMATSPPTANAKACRACSNIPTTTGASRPWPNGWARRLLPRNTASALQTLHVASTVAHGSSADGVPTETGAKASTRTKPDATIPKPRHGNTVSEPSTMYAAWCRSTAGKNISARLSTVFSLSRLNCVPTFKTLRVSSDSMPTATNPRTIWPTFIITSACHGRPSV